MDSRECDATSISPDNVIYKGVFNLDAYNHSIGKKLTFLKETEYMKIQFMPIGKDYYVIEGKVVCTFNGNARIEFSIPEQLMQKKLVFIRELAPVFDKVFK